MASVTSDFKTDREIKHLLVPLTADEYATLEENIVRDGKCHDSLKVWKEKGILLDGHNRKTICDKHGITYDVEELSFASREAAIAWVYLFHYGRRNQTPEQMAYVRGKRYEAEKQEQGAPEGNRNASKQIDQNDPVVTADRLAEEFKVGSATIKRDAKFATAVDAIAEALGKDARQQILSRESPVPKGKVQKLASIAQQDPQLAEKVLRKEVDIKDVVLKDGGATSPDPERDIFKDQEKFRTLLSKLSAHWSESDRAIMRQFFRQLVHEIE